MTVNNFTAGEVRKHLLFPAMDATAVNAEEGRLIYNPSPEVDSLVEHLALIRPYIPIAEFSKLLTLVKQIMDANERESRLERQIAGFADQMSHAMRSLETNGAPA
jgi:hypothetical protein